MSAFTCRFSNPSAAAWALAGKKAALVLEPEQMLERFAEMTMEANQYKREFHIFHDRTSAAAWLLES